MAMLCIRMNMIVEILMTVIVPILLPSQFQWQKDLHLIFLSISIQNKIFCIPFNVWTDLKRKSQWQRRKSFDINTMLPQLTATLTFTLIVTNVL